MQSNMLGILVLSFFIFKLSLPKQNFFYLRKDNGIEEPLISFHSPCTSEYLRLACEDQIVNDSKVLPKTIQNGGKNTTEKLWAVRP